MIPRLPVPRLRRKNIVRTTINEGHSHLWTIGETFTTMNDKHQHRVSGGIALPIISGGHHHTILL